MKITVVCATARLGGLDVTSHAIRNQERPPDLFVLVDEWFHLRDKHVTELFEGVNYKHVFPGWENFGVSRIAQAHNFGTQFVDEGLLVWMNDYMYAHPDWLARMEKFADAFDGWSLSGAQYRYEFDDKTILPTIANTFKEPFEPFRVFAAEPSFRDFRTNLKSVDGMPFPELDPAFWFGGINDSTLVKYGQQIGWLDERLDGGLGGQDIDYAFRASRLGHRYAFDASLITHEIRGDVHYSPALHRCPVTTRENGLPASIAKYHKRIINEDAPVDWREDNE